jgi:hypothetical protein
MKRNLLLLTIVLAGCGGEDWHGTVETLPNGAVRVTNPATGAWGVDGGWRLTPLLSIGELEGADATMFASISGLEASADGRIFVLDRQANELRIFAAAGNHLRTSGRAGAGPGEYANANGLFWLAPDTLVVVDQRGNRYSILDDDGNYVRSVPRNVPFYGWAFTGGHYDGIVYEVYALGPERDQPALLGTPLGGARVALQDVADSGDAATDSPHQAPRDTILLERYAMPQEFFQVRNERGGMTMTIPFAPALVRHLDRHGSIWSGHGSAFRIVRTRLAGDTIMEINLDATPVAVTDAELEEWRGGAGPRQFREMGGDLDMSRVPRQKPYFDSFYADPDEHLWVSVPAGDRQIRFAIFDPDGRYLGNIDIPGVRRVGWIDPVVRDDRLYLVGQDDLDVQRVHVFRIER